MFNIKFPVSISILPTYTPPNVNLPALHLHPPPHHIAQSPTDHPVQSLKPPYHPNVPPALPAPLAQTTALTDLKNLVVKNKLIQQHHHQQHHHQPYQHQQLLKQQ